MKPTLDDIFYASLEAWDTDEETYRNLKYSREALAVNIRQFICWLAQRNEYSLHEIGQYLGIDHSTVHYNKKKVEDYLSYDTEYISLLNKAMETIDKSKEDIKVKEITIDGYITRDEDGELTLWEGEPIREKFSDGNGYWCGESPRDLDPTLFPWITWSTKPQPCEIIVKIK